MEDLLGLRHLRRAQPLPRLPPTLTPTPNLAPNPNPNPNPYPYPYPLQGPVEDKRLFELLTCETEESLRPGMLTTARQVRFEMGRDNGEGRIHVQVTLTL